MSNSRIQTIFNDLPGQELPKVKSLTQTAARARAEALAMFGLRKQKGVAQATLTNAAAGSRKVFVSYTFLSHC